jgi:hypothetical protein
MSQASIASTRHKLWLAATYLTDFSILPPFTARSLNDLAPGQVHFRAARTEGLEDRVGLVVLDVAELWLPGADPHGDRRLESEGCHVSALSWHLQVHGEPSDRSAERLDVVPTADPEHPRIHRHPYGEPNRVRVEANFDPPSVWLSLACSSLPGIRPDSVTWDQDLEE